MARSSLVIGSRSPERSDCMVIAMRASSWPVENTGNWTVDNKAGREFAHDLAQRMREQGAPNLLYPTVKAMVERGVTGGAECGFCQAIAEMASR